MTIDEVRHIATQVVHEQASGFEVLGVTAAEGGSDYTEIFLDVRDCPDEVCRLTLGLDRAVSPEALRAQLLKKLDEIGRTS
jgi:hypothetical protein